MDKEKLSKDEIESRVKQVISRTVDIKSEKLSSNLDLTNDLGVDSFTAIELAYNAEDEFGVTISDDELQKITTIGDIVSVVQKKLE